MRLTSVKGELSSCQIERGKFKSFSNLGNGFVSVTKITQKHFNINFSKQ